MSHIPQPTAAYYTPQQAAELLHVSLRTLEKWRFDGTGPSFIKMGGNGRIRYTAAAIDAWMVAQTKTSTSQRDDA